MNRIKILLLPIMLFSIICDVYSQKGVDSLVSNEQEVKGRRNAISTFNMFRDPSYILFGSGLGNMEPLIFEGNLAPYFMISISENVRWGIELSPRIVIRMYNEYSLPVRTPSFMPKVTFFYQFLDKENGKRDLFTYITTMHHSNGQEDDFFNPDSTTINTLTGNFSTNWIEGGLFLSRPNAKLLFNTNYIKLYATYNYMQEQKLSGTYGRLRFFVNIKSSVKLSEAFKIIVAPEDLNKKYAFNQSIKVGWIAGKLNDEQNFSIKRFTVNYTVSFTPTFLKDVNIFFQYYYGQDYYNIHFNRQLNVIRIGISSKSSILF
ncbi:hypothetical protein G8O23_09095 [Bacteroidales bacterium M08MB]|nr:hypothetical protein [Perlabentimonas gracilis]